MNFKVLKAVHVPSCRFSLRELNRVKAIIEAYSCEYPDGEGSSCDFYKINEHIGLKLFRGRTVALRTYHVHRHLFVKAKRSVPYIMGPLMMVRVEGGYTKETYADVAYPDGNTLYAYVVQLCKPARRCDEDGPIYEKAVKLSLRLYKLVKGLYPRYAKWVFEDVHSGNFGYLGQRLVWIDFSI